MAGAGVERLQTPIVKDEELDAGKGAQQPSIATIAAGQREIGEQFGDTLVEDGAIVAAGLVAECCSQPGFADAGRAAQDQIVVGLDPAIQLPSASFLNNARSRPRGAR